MKLFFHKRYDRFEGACAEDFGPGVSEALLNGYAVPNHGACPKAYRRLQGASYRELQTWAKALGVAATGTTDELRESVDRAICKAKNMAKTTKEPSYLTVRPEPLDKGSKAAREKLGKMANKETGDGPSQVHDEAQGEAQDRSRGDG